MAVVKPRTAIVIVLTILVAAVFSLILLPRWRSKTNAVDFPQQTGDQSNVYLKPLPAESRGTAKVDRLDADKDAMWSPQSQQAAARKSGLGKPPPINSEIERVAGPSPRSDSNKRPEPAGKPRETAEFEDSERPLNNMRNLKETKSLESQPQAAPKNGPSSDEELSDREKTPNALKYERLRSLLGRMHDPHVHMEELEGGDLGRNDKAQKLAKEALEKLADRYNNDGDVMPEEILEIVDKGKEREIPLKFEPNNERDRAQRDRERQLTFGMNKGLKPDGERRQRIEGQPDTSVIRKSNKMTGWPQRTGNSGNTRAAMGNPDRREKPTKATTPVLTTTIPSTTTPPATTRLNPVKDLPSMKKGSVEIRPERLTPPADSSDIYYSLLTAPLYHNLRFSLQYLTWLQTVDPKHVNIITDKEDNEWIQAFKKEGGNIHIPKCPLSTRKTREMMCCKTGAQFDYWYRAREAGMNYKWYCHFDDDLYVNPQALTDLLSQHDPTTDQYLGAWAVVGRVHRQNRIPGNMLAPKLHTYAERKRNDFRYANGPSYCISEALMMKVEKYLRGKNFEDNCRKSDAVMDDVLPGVIIDGVLGIDLQDIPGFKSQLDFMLQANSQEMKRQAQDIISIGFGRFTITDAKFFRGTDTKGVLSYHCLLHPEVSWCR